MSDDWRELADDEVEALRPYMIHAADLSAADCAALRTIAANLLTELVETIRCYGLVPTEEDERILTRLVVAEINSTIVPAMRQRSVGLH
jgi:hypothetical protein